MLGPSTRRFWFLGPILLAVAIRIVVVAANWDSPFVTVPLIDARNFHEKAMLVAAGDPLPTRPFDRPPLLIYFAGLLYRLFGTDPRVVVVAHHVLGVACVWLVVVLGRRWWGPLAGGVAGIWLAACALPVALESQVLNEPLQTFLILATVFALMRSSRGVPMGWRIAAAVAASLAILARPTSALFVVPAFVALLVQDVRRGARGSVVVASLVFLTLSGSAAVRNARTTGEFVPVSYNGGINFFIGNASTSEALIDIRPGLEWERLVQTPRALEQTNVFRLDPWADGVAAWDRRYWAAGLADIRDDPARALVRVGKKTLQFWSVADIDRNVPLHVFVPAYVPLLPFAALGPFALAGLLLLLARRPRGWVWPAGMVLSVWVTCALFFVTSRYRMPAYPAMAWSAAYWFWAALDTRGRSRAVWTTLVVALLVSVLDLGDARHVRPAREHFLRGVALEESHRLEAALSEYEAALVDDPGDADANFRAMSILMRERRMADAARLGERAVALVPDHPLPRFNLGLAYSALGRYEDAVRVFRGMTDAVPSDPRGYFQLGRALIDAGRPDEALVSFDVALRLAPAVDLTYVERARALVALGRDDDARKSLSIAIARDPSLRGLALNMPELRAIAESL